MPYSRGSTGSVSIASTSKTHSCTCAKGAWATKRVTTTLPLGEVRPPIPPEPGQLERFDFECRRNGTVNFFVFLDAHRPWRKVKVPIIQTAEHTSWLPAPRRHRSVDNSRWVL